MMNTSPASKEEMYEYLLKAPLITIPSNDLFKDGSKEVIILHNDSEYRLRITAANKLILTK